MNKKIIFKASTLLMAIVFMVIICICFNPFNSKSISLQYTTKLEHNERLQLFYTLDDDMQFSEEKTNSVDVSSGKEEKIEFSFPIDAKYVRLDFGGHSGEVKISNLELTSGNYTQIIDDEYIKNNSVLSGIEKLSFSDSTITIDSNSEDPYIVLPVEEFNMGEHVKGSYCIYNIISKIIMCAVIIFLVYLFLKHFSEYMEFPKEIWGSRKLILQLSKNDFKTKFAGSYLGIIWAFIQPVVTVLVYWFVFQQGLRSGGVANVPFVLWLIAGLVPWFFFSDALNGGTNALLEYQYLVKKVVFQINILPVVKVLSALYVHIFFVLFSLVLYACYGLFPDIYYLQIIYYSFCMFIFVLGISYFTSAVVGFFRDLSQIIGIVLQVGVWMTPIMWNIDTMGLPEWLKKIFELNPMYYIVSGYRDSLINKVWFWEQANLSIYFWVLTIFFFAGGTLVFKKLKIHFADVL